MGIYDEYINYIIYIESLSGPLQDFIIIMDSYILHSDIRKHTNHSSNITDNAKRTDYKIFHKVSVPNTHKPHTRLNVGMTL